MEGSDILHELNEVEFPTKLRGYDPFEVDKMLERAQAEISDLRSRAQAADERVLSAEEQLDVELAAARQAHREAEDALAVAKEEAERVVADARTEAERLLIASEAEVREVIESGRSQLLGELAVLESRREATQDAIQLAERQIAAHRDRLLSATGDLQILVEGLTVVQGSADLEGSADMRLGISTEGSNDPVECSTAGSDSVGVVHQMDISSPAVETGGSEDRKVELGRPVAGTDTDTAAIERFFSGEGGGRFETGRH